VNINGRHGKCQTPSNVGVDHAWDGCVGPGCRVYTGKTARKRNDQRPKYNKHEGTRVVAREEGKKR